MHLRTASLIIIILQGAQPEAGQLEMSFYDLRMCSVLVRILNIWNSVPCSFSYQCKHC